MHILKRRLYKRGSSYEVTIPIPILFGLDLKIKHSIVFSNIKGIWHIQFDSKADKNEISRSIYKRGSSYETTIPFPLILNLDSKKSYNVLFKFDKSWFIEFEETKHAS